MYYKTCCGVIGWLLLTATCAASDDPDQVAVLRNVDSLDDTPGIEAPAKPEVWDLRLGLLGAVHPDYAGSDDYDTSLAPYFRINWKDTIVFSGRSLRARVFNRHGFSLGPVARLRGGRDEGDNDDLRGLGDDDNALEVGGFLRYRTGPYRLRLTAVHDVAGGHNGAVVEMGAGMQVPFERPWFLLMGKATWADQDYTSSYFGITPGQAAGSGLRPFAASAGIRDVGFSISSRLPLWRGLSLVAVLNYERLLGDAADSPLTARLGSPNQLSASTGFIYRF